LARWPRRSGCCPDEDGGQTILVHLLRRGPAALAQTVCPFGPFILWGVVVLLLWSVDKIIGIRTLIFWSLAAGTAVAAGQEVGARTLARSVALLFVTIVAGSLLLAVLAPGAAHTAYGDTVVLRGLFPHKNQFGWYCAIGLFWTLALRGEIGPRCTVAVLPILLFGLVAAGSITAQAVTVVGLGYLAALRFSTGTFADGSRGALGLTLAIAVGAGAATVMLPTLLDHIGRDATLTGRTEVWRHYSSYIEGSRLTGLGTGIFSTGSEMNMRIGGSVPGYERERLHSPHSTYLGLLGEAGLIAVLLFAGAHAYIALVAPFRVLSPWRRLSAVLAVAILSAGLAEMRDGYAPGVATVALLTARSAGIRAERRQNHLAAARRNPMAQAL
jgi:hypothetical protein